MASAQELEDILQTVNFPTEYRSCSELNENTSYRIKKFSNVETTWGPKLECLLLDDCGVALKTILSKRFQKLSESVDTLNDALAKDKKLFLTYFGKTPQGALNLHISQAPLEAPPTPGGGLIG